ncbi:ABC transporter ATP-binding protein [bacterium]|nr:ABC transporter ATP-binding protein [bacterium]
MIELQNVSKVYAGQDGEVRALDHVNLSIQRGEFVVIRGPSGSGKSTLLLTAGGLVRPTEGKVVVDGKDIYTLSSRERASFRGGNIGFVFQMFHLLPYLNVLENVLVPTISGARKSDRTEAAELLQRLKMSDRLHHRPSQLSTGQRQRVAIARALLNRPRVILADEPTGNLDPDNAAEVLDYLTEFHKAGGTVLLVTHEQYADEYAQRIVLLQNGKISFLREESLKPSHATE